MVTKAKNRGQSNLYLEAWGFPQDEGLGRRCYMWTSLRKMHVWSKTPRLWKLVYQGRGIMGAHGFHTGIHGQSNRIWRSQGKG